MAHAPWRVLVTGANGFIGKNLVLHLQSVPIPPLARWCAVTAQRTCPRLAQADAVVHLAGENRPLDEAALAQVNAGLTTALCDAMAQEIKATGRHIPLVLASSTQVLRDDAYGRSKLAAEDAVRAFGRLHREPLHGVPFARCFWQVVQATLQLGGGYVLPPDCAWAAHCGPRSSRLCAAGLRRRCGCRGGGCAAVQRTRLQAGAGRPEYAITLGELPARSVQAFGACRTTLLSERVGQGLTRRCTQPTSGYLPADRFSYPVPQHADPRGVFVEMLKTPDSGQFSYFTAHPGVTRGGHYHHSKTEKFLVIQGEALFRFRHLLTQELVELRTSGSQPQVVDTIPGGRMTSPIQAVPTWW